MPTPFISRQAVRSNRADSAATQPSASASSEWRCRHCGKLLGMIAMARVHLRFARGHEYLVGLPVTATCRGCRTLNELSAPGATEAHTPQSR